MINWGCLVLQVLLQLCEPFIDPLSGKAWPRLDARWVAESLFWSNVHARPFSGRQRLTCLP